MTIAVVASAKVAGPTGGTTSAIDTTGATLLVVSATYSRGGGFTLSDSKGNTWTALNIAQDGSFLENRLFYAANPTVGTGHTFTAAGGNLFQDIAVVAFSGVPTSSPFDTGKQNTNAGAIAAIAPGSSGTPSAAGSLLVSGFGGTYTSSPPTIGSSFSIEQTNPFSGGNNYGNSIAWKVSSTAENPTWTGNDATDSAATIAVFKPGAGTETGTAVLGFSGISFNASGAIAHVKGSANLAFRGISFNGVASVAHVKGTANLAFGGISIHASGIDPGAPGAGPRQFWTM